MKRNNLARNSFYNVCYKLLNMIFPLVTSIYVARILKADSIGRVAAAQNIVSYFTMIATMGIPIYGIKAIAQYEIGSKENETTFFELFTINAVLSVLSSVGYYLFITLSSYFDGKEFLYYITGINVLFNILNVDWYYQGIQEYRYIAIRSFLVKLLSMLALIIFVRGETDYILYAFISSAALVANYLFNIIRLIKLIHKPDLGSLKIRRHIKHVLLLFVSNIAIEIYVLADTTMLDYMTDSSIVGYYTVSLKVIRVIRNAVAAISAVFLPQLSYSYNNNDEATFLRLANRGISILVTLSIPSALGLCMIADDFITVFYGIDYIESINTIRILSFSIVSVALSNFLGTQLFVTIGKEKITTLSTICGAALNVTLNYLLIPKFLQNGAATASMLTELLVMLIQVIMNRKYMNLSYGIWKPLISSLCMCLAVFVIRRCIAISVVRLVVSCCVGAIVYFGVSYMIRNTFVIELVNFIKGRLYLKFVKKESDRN